MTPTPVKDTLQFTLVKETVSKPSATLEVVKVEIPSVVQEGINRSIQSAKQSAQQPVVTR